MVTIMTPMQGPTYRLFWLQETGCDAGTPIEAVELPEMIRERIVSLTRGGPEEFHIRLPFLDRTDRRRQDDLLAMLPFERVGNLIRPVLGPVAAARDLAATLVMTDPLWTEMPPERDPENFRIWRRVAVHIQRWIRERVAEEYFRDIDRLADRRIAYPMVVYQACRPCFGKSRNDLIYDLRDYPWCDDTLRQSWKMLGRPLERCLAVYEERLERAGRRDLSFRYSPAFNEDILIAVKRKPKRYADLLARESRLLSDLIDMGSQRTVESVNRFARTLDRTLRKMHGCDMRHLGVPLLEETTRILEEKHADYTENVIDIGAYQNTHVRAARGPDHRIAA